MAVYVNFDPAKYPQLQAGYNDLNRDGAMDTLVFEWNNKTAVFVSDDGKLPWGAEMENSDWSAYFNKAFGVDDPGKNPWRTVRSSWGSYTLFVDKDGDGRFDTNADYCYRAFDVNGDGGPESEYYHLFPGQPDMVPFSNKLVVNLDGAREMSDLDFHGLTYKDEQKYGAGGKYHMNVQGSGFFVNSYAQVPITSWETPIAWYDFDFDGKNNLVMRVGDIKNNIDLLQPAKGESYSGLVSDFEVAFELNGNTSEEKYHSLDLMLSFKNYEDPTLDYRQYEDYIPYMKPLEGSEFLYGSMAESRLLAKRQYMPYLDGYAIGMAHKDWRSVLLLMDEDDDDNRWEEMFSNHEDEESAGEKSGWYRLADKIGDRTEIDKDYKGEGKLYIGRFDGRIHLYHAESCFWEIDYLGLYKGSTDHAGSPEGPPPPKGLRYQRVLYFDTTGNGYIDTIQYETVRFEDEENTREVTKVVKLGDYADAELESPDVMALFDPRVQVPLTGWKLESWDGNPLTREDFAASPANAGYTKMHDYYGKVCDGMWEGAMKLYSVAKEYGLNTSEALDIGLKTAYTLAELEGLEDILVPKGYSRHLKGETRREKYHNGYWLKEKVLIDLCESGLFDSFLLEKYFYTGRYDTLCAYVREVMEKR